MWCLTTAGMMPHVPAQGTDPPRKLCGVRALLGWERPNPAPWAFGAGTKQEKHKVGGREYHPSPEDTEGFDLPTLAWRSAALSHALTAQKDQQPAQRLHLRRGDINPLGSPRPFASWADGYGFQLGEETPWWGHPPSPALASPHVWLGGPVTHTATPAPATAPRDLERF